MQKNTVQADSWLEKYRAMLDTINKMEHHKIDADNEKHAAVINQIIGAYMRDMEASVRAAFVTKIVASGCFYEITRNLTLDSTFEDLLNATDQVHADWHKNHEATKTCSEESGNETML